MAQIIDLIGNTPLIEVPVTSRGRVFAKLESNNPGGSIKDRPAKQMILDLLASGKITNTSKLVEPTSGNTGIGLAMVCAALKLSLTIIMPHTMSIERRKLIQAYGAKLIIVKTGIPGCIALADQMVVSQGYTKISQFDNPSNPLSHKLTTGPEIEKQCAQYNITPAYFLAGVGSGGTISGVQSHLKTVFPSIKTVTLEPQTSQIFSGGKPGPHKIQGIAPGFVADNYEKTDIIRQINDDDAINMVQQLARCGILCGISSGANIFAAKQLAEQEGVDVVTIINDSGERYLSVDGLFQGMNEEIVE
ncbi:Cysteine synthase [Spironucleus salmonicida]|uniref:Cysteine synthase n=1 Tax=Spironucleus salmonicida TaxID=348837 RepID=V6LI93_9EUKA|nr:Cysteine synthase [Spironucleus salmonicida]|eukprot:EST43431.1 Cysteine synthase [Spironucleus salmonicida]